MNQYKGHEIKEISSSESRSQGYKYYIPSYHHSGMRYDEQYCRKFRSINQAKNYINDLVKSREIEELMQNELAIFDDTILAKSGLSLLHSLGATISKRIEIFDRADQDLIEGSKNTYQIKDTLKAQGFKWDNTAKRWWIENTEQNKEKLIAILNAHSRKCHPSSLKDVVQCWECGCMKKRSECERDGGMWYCGC